MLRRNAKMAVQQVFWLHLVAFERGTAGLADVYGNEFAFIGMCHIGDRVDVRSTAKSALQLFVP
jgi:acyl dehydratase